MNRAPDDILDLVSSARILVSELIEEGVTEFDSAPPSPRKESLSPSPSPSPSPLPAPAEAGKIGEIRAGSDGTSAAPGPSAAGLETVREALGNCQRCDLHGARKKIVFGTGNPEARLLFIGEAPGENEDRQGLPFVGRAGELLTQMIEKGIGIPREEVYICNILKCRPPSNRNPLPPEVAACRPFLDGQIDAIGPKVIVTLGKPAAGLLLGREVAITRIRGQWHEYRGIPLMPTLHPAYVLRQYSEQNRRAVWQDLRAAYERTRQE